MEKSKKYYTNWKELDSKYYNEGEKTRDKISIIEDLNGGKRVSLKGELKIKNGWITRKSTWRIFTIPAESVLELFNWALTKLGIKSIKSEEEINNYESRIDELTKELVYTKEKLETAIARQKEQEITLNLARELKNNLINYKTEFKEFKNLIYSSISSNIGKEEEIKNKIKNNPWILGLECQVEAKNKNVDTQTQIDLHVITRFGESRIFEVKSPNIKPFKRKDNDSKRRLVLSQELSDGLSELILYMKRTNAYSEQKNEGNYGITKASGVILIGNEPDQAEKEMLNELNFHLKPHIQIVTYNELINNANRELSMIEKVGEEKP